MLVVWHHGKSLKQQRHLLHAAGIATEPSDAALLGGTFHCCQLPGLGAAVPGRSCWLTCGGQSRLQEGSTSAPRSLLLWVTGWCGAAAGRGGNPRAWRLSLSAPRLTWHGREQAGRGHRCCGGLCGQQKDELARLCQEDKCLLVRKESYPQGSLPLGSGGSP